jgi:HEPN domain-containing protein
MAQRYFDKQLAAVDRWIKLAKVSRQESETDEEWAKNAAFNLHQATETAYACFLLVQTLYFPRSHNIKFLRSIAEDKEPRLVHAWPRANRSDRRRFELLKRAYVEARYSPSYQISPGDLDSIASAVGQLRNIVEQLCITQLRKLESDAAA